MKLPTRNPGLLGLLLLVPIGAMAGPEHAHQAAENLPREQSLQQGWGLFHAGYVNEAEEAFRQMLEADESCDECRLGLAAVNNRRGDFPQGEELARESLAHDLTPLVEARAQWELGHALRGQAQSEKRKLLRKAARAFDRVIELGGELQTPSRFFLGDTLFLIGDYEQGTVAFEGFLEVEPEGARAIRSRLLIAEPECARLNCAPRFELEMNDGNVYNKAALRGKVVLLDVWASWCKPCIEAIPDLLEMNELTEHEPFVILGISVDDSREQMDGFVEEHGIPWPQYLDSSRSVIHSMFAIGAFPTHLLIDHEGLVRYRAAGWSDEIATKLAEETRKAIADANAARNED